jgi:hypothetical protein
MESNKEASHCEFELLTICFHSENMFSIGFKKGEYGGR